MLCSCSSLLASFVVWLFHTSNAAESEDGKSRVRQVCATVWGYDVGGVKNVIST